MNIRLLLLAFGLILTVVVLLAAEPALVSKASTTLSHDQVCRARGERLVGHLLAGRFTAAAQDFDPTMAGALPPAKLEEAWGQIKAAFGLPTGAGPGRVQGMGPYTIVFVPCRGTKAALDVKVVFSSDQRVAGLFFVPGQPRVDWTAPAYADPAAFTETEVNIGTPPWQLPGTLTLPVPQGAGRVPGIVLVHGSGPNDRDETIGPNKPFKDLAHGLAAKGIAVLRYEKRTRQYPKECSVQAAFTLQEETINDAHAGATLLAAHPRIDPKACFVLGHSLGGMAAPRIAEQAPNLAGIIILAGTTRRLEDVMTEQFDYLASLQEPLPDDEKEKLAAVKGLLSQVKALTRANAADPTPILGAPPAYWLALRAYSPTTTVARLPQRILVLQGERDYQVTMADFQGWQKALAGNSRATLTSFPELNHLFMGGTGKSTPAEYEKSGHVDSRIIATIVSWVSGGS